METGAAGMGRGKDTVRRHLWRAVLQLMKPAHRTEFLTVPPPAVMAVAFIQDKGGAPKSLSRSPTPASRSFDPSRDHQQIGRTGQSAAEELPPTAERPRSHRMLTSILRSQRHNVRRDQLTAALSGYLVGGGEVCRLLLFVNGRKRCDRPIN